MTQDRSTNKPFNTIFNPTLNKHDASQRQSRPLTPARRLPRRARPPPTQARRSATPARRLPRPKRRRLTSDKAVDIHDKTADARDQTSSAYFTEDRAKLAQAIADEKTARDKAQEMEKKLADNLSELRIATSKLDAMAVAKAYQSGVERLIHLCREQGDTIRVLQADLAVHVQEVLGEKRFVQAEREQLRRQSSPSRLKGTAGKPVSGRSSRTLDRS